MTENPPAAEPHRSTFNAAADLHLVDQTLDEVARLCAQVGDVEDEERLQFSLGVSEVLTNMVKHGMPGGGRDSMTLWVELVVDRHRLFAQLRDDAEPLTDPHILDQAALPGELAESGRGLAIASMVLHGVQHHVQDGNVWTLWRERT